MKRLNYDITLNGELIETKHALNSSLRFIERKVKEFADKETTVIHQIDKTWNNDKSYSTRTWRSEKGKEYYFEVVKQ